MVGRALPVLLSKWSDYIIFFSPDRTQKRIASTWKSEPQSVGSLNINFIFPCLWEPQRPALQFLLELKHEAI